MRLSLLNFLALLGVAFCTRAAEPVLVPQIDGDFWQVAGDPDLGKYTTAKQQPVDFGIWQAADGTWQLWSCIRSTAVPGKTRLFYRWQGKNLTDKDWTPMGIAMLADPNFGETEGGLQAPFVLKENSVYNLFYGNWEQIALAKSMDGKSFARQLTPKGVSGMFGEGEGNNTRDPMVLKIGSVYYCYYTAYPNHQGAVYVRTSKDKTHWSAAQTVNYGGAQGNGPFSAECPFVYYHKASGYYYLLRNQVYGAHAQFAVYRSKNPRDFGKDNDQYLVETMPYAAPEIIESNGQLYMAVLLPSLKGIQIAKLKFAVQSDLNH
jgi:Glycosyl hydrolases family 32 N-terminal domain